MSKTAVVLIALAVAQPVFAQSMPNPGSTTRFGSHRPARPDPYRTLFHTQPATRTAPDVVTATKPVVVCGMTVVPADPSLDSKFYVTGKSDSVDYTLRKVTPPVCSPAR